MKQAVLGCAALVLCVHMASASEGVTLAQGVTLSPGDGFPDMKVPAEMEAYRHAYFVLVNDSDRAITAVSAVWSYTSIETGKRKAGIMKTVDSYMLNNGPAVKPHSRMPVEPGSAALHYFADARNKKITLTVDLIIFEDGEIVGPDQLKTADEITARYAAAHEVSSLFHMGRLAGKQTKQIVGELRIMNRNRWHDHYLSRMTAAGDNVQLADLHLRALDQLPEPPHFFRKGETK